MDEVSDPAISVLAEGLSLDGGPKFNILNKIKDTSCLALLLTGQRNNILSLQTKSKKGCEATLQQSLCARYAEFRCKKKRSASEAHVNNAMFHTRVRAINRIGPHNHDIISVIVGSLLGDCYASKRSVEGTRLVYKQSIVHKDYLFWLYTFFNSRGYCSNLEPRMYTRKLKREDQVKEYYGYEFHTYTFRSLDWVHRMFYKKGKKVVSLEIEKYLTPLALAVWLMDAGKSVGGRVEICTYFYTRQDMDKLVNVLNNLYGLNCSLSILLKKVYVE